LRCCSGTLVAVLPGNRKKLHGGAGMRKALKIAFDVAVFGGFVVFLIHLSLKLPEPAQQWLAEASRSAANHLLAQVF
jgi:hypothetical protein